MNSIEWLKQLLNGCVGGADGYVATFRNGRLVPEAAGASSVPTTITVANEATDTTCFPLFVTAATGDLGPKTVSSFTLNSNTGALGITSIDVGNADTTLSRNAAGVLQVEGNIIYHQGGALGTPASGALENCTNRATALGVVTTTTGTAFDSALPSGCKKFVISFKDVSWNSATGLLIQLADSGGLETTGYESMRGIVTEAGVADAARSTNGFVWSGGFGAGLTIHGNVTFVRNNNSGEYWSCSGIIGVSDSTDYVTWQGGSKALSGELTSVRITSSAGATFDSGSYNIDYWT